MKFHHISYGKQLTANKYKNQSKHRKSASRGRIALAPFAVMAVFAVAAIASPFVLSNNFARADSYDSQINALQNQNSDLNAQVSQLALQAGSIKAAIAALQNQQARLQTQIDASTAKIADLTNQIAAAEQQITQQSQAVVNALKNMYYDKQSSSTLNIIMNSNSVSDYVNAQARQTTIQNNLQKSIDKINELKQQLANKKAQVQTLLNSQQDQKKTLIASQAEQQSLENANVAQQADFNSKVSANNSQISKLKAERDALARANNNSQCGGGYPYCGSAQDSMVDPWGLYNRECVSYAAYKVNSTYGNMPYMGGNGNAAQWPGHLAGRVPEGSTPKVGSVAIKQIAPYGHAAWVEAVNGDSVTVSQYNWDLEGHYSTMTVPSSFFSTYIYFQDYKIGS